MKNLKLLSIAIVLVIIAFVLKTHNTKVVPIDSLVGKSIIASNKLDKIKSISLITSKEQIEIKHDNTSWRIPKLHDMRADNNRIEELFQQLNSSKIVELVSKNPERYQAMGVADTSGTSKIGLECAKIIMTNEQNQEISNIYLGNGRQAKMVDGSQGYGNDGQYLRHKGTESVYLISNFIRIESQIKNWLDKQLLRFAVDNIQNISWKYANNSEFQIKRELASESLALANPDKDNVTDKSEVDQTAKLLSDLKFADFIATNSPKLHSSLANAIECSIEGFDGLKLSMKISSGPVALPSLGKVYLLLLTSEYTGNDTSLKSYAEELNTRSGKLLYAIREASLKPFLVKKQDLQKPAPKPTTEGNASDTTDIASLDKVSASHILIAYKGASRSKATRSEKEAKELVDNLLGKIKKGEDFNKLAKENSDCPSGKSAEGSLGEFKRGAMAKEFEKSAFSLKVGEISEIVKTPFGYHIIRRDK